MAEPIQNPIKMDIIRIQKGMSLRELADRSGISKRTLDEWSQRRNIARDVYKLQKIAKVLECSIEDLIEPIETYTNKKSVTSKL